MRVRLLHPEHDVDLSPRLPNTLIYLNEDDLELQRLYKAMADDDSFLLEVAQKVVPLTVADPDVIVYRQQVLADCLANRDAVQRMYAIAVEGDEVRRKVYLSGIVFREPGHILERITEAARTAGGEPQTTPQVVRRACRPIPLGRFPAVDGDGRRSA